MKRQLMLAAMFVAAISGCISTDNGPETGGMRPTYGKSFGPPTVPGVEGPYGTKIPMVAPYNTPSMGSQAAARMMSNNIPTSLLQINPGGMPMGGPPGMGMPPTLMPPGGIMSPPGVPGMPGMPGGMPPANPLMKTGLQGMMPDAGVMNANIPPGVREPGGVLSTQFASSSPVGSMFPAQRTQVYFGHPVRMKVYWFTQGSDGKPNYSTIPLETPGRYNFAQGAIYRLKLTNITGRPALELYPTLEVVPTSPKTNEFLAHNSVPLDFSEDDFKQVVDRNYIVKVIYLPDPQFQDAAGAGPGEITSAQLEPGQDPIQEALRRGSILLVLRIGNIDQGLISSPATTAPIQSGPPMMMKPPGMGVPPGVQIPFNMTPITPEMPPAGMIPPGMGVPPPAVAPPGGGGASPNPLLPLGPGGNPPLLKVSGPAAPPALKPEISNNDEAIQPPLLPPPSGLPPPPELQLGDGVKPWYVPVIPLPAPNVDKPAGPPMPITVEKTGMSRFEGFPTSSRIVIDLKLDVDSWFTPKLPSDSPPNAGGIPRNLGTTEKTSQGPSNPNVLPIPPAPVIPASTRSENATPASLWPIPDRQEQK